MIEKLCTDSSPMGLGKSHVQLVERSQCLLNTQASLCVLQSFSQRTSQDMMGGHGLGGAYDHIIVSYLFHSHIKKKKKKKKKSCTKGLFVPTCLKCAAWGEHHTVDKVKKMCSRTCNELFCPMGTLPPYYCSHVLIV